MSGITYYRLSPSDYHQNMVGYDFTKYSSLTGNEIDLNFHYLEGVDIHTVTMDGEYLVIERIDGTTERVKIDPYTQSCGIVIGEDNTISLNLKQLGGISCFQGEAYVSTGCGLRTVTEQESCKGFGSFLIRLLGTNTAIRYITCEIPINGQFYGGRTSVSVCDSVDCRNDQFYADYLQSIRNGLVTLDVCGIECDNGSAKVSTDGESIVLDDCTLKVNYGCGIAMHNEETEQDYINFLSYDWETISGQTIVSLECYLSGTHPVPSTETSTDYYYTKNTGDFRNDQFHSQFTFSPTLRTDIDEYGGLICRNDGIGVDCGCGLDVNGEGDFNAFKNYLKSFFNYSTQQLSNLCDTQCTGQQTYWKNDPHYGSYVECLDSGALQVSLGNNGGIACIGGSLYISIGCGLEIEPLTPCCQITDETSAGHYSYQRFLTDNWGRLTGETTNHANTYWTGNYEYGCEKFGHSSCANPCSPCDIWYNDQFFCSYVSFINAGRLRVKTDGTTITCNQSGQIATT